MRVHDQRQPTDVSESTNGFTVARYDDDYPLLYGEPARQPAAHLTQVASPVESRVSLRDGVPVVRAKRAVTPARAPA